MAERDCQKCKRWKGCPGKDWYHYGDIRWCPRQIIWILQYAEQFEAGDYPVQYEALGGSRQIKAEGYFVRPETIIAEVRERLRTTPNQGELLITQVEDGRVLGNLSPGAYEILMYVKGWRRKDRDFNTWKRERDYRHSIRNRMQNAELDKESV